MDNEIFKTSFSILRGTVNQILLMINSLFQTVLNSFDYLLKSIQFLIIQPILNLIKLIIFIIVLLPLHIVISIVFGFDYNNKLSFNLFEIFNEFLQILKFFYQFLATSIIFGIIIGLASGITLFIVRYLFTWSFSSFEIFSFRSIVYKILNYFGVIKFYNFLIDTVSTVTNNIYNLKNYKFEDGLKKERDDKISIKIQSPQRKPTLSPSPVPTAQEHLESFKSLTSPKRKLSNVKLKEKEQEQEIQKEQEKEQGQEKDQDQEKEQEPESLQEKKQTKILGHNTLDVEQFKEFLSVDKINDEIEIKYEITTTPSDISVAAENIKKNQSFESTVNSNKDKKPLWRHNGNGDNDDHNDIKDEVQIQELNSKINEINSSEESSRISTAATQSGYDTSNILQDEDEDDDEVDDEDDYNDNQRDKRGDTPKDDDNADTKKET